MEPFVGEIRSFAFGLVPRGWFPCDGRALSPRQFAPLFSLLGTTYGGDGVNSFNLPDLRGRTPLSQGKNYPLGASGGAEAVLLNLGGLPPHNHSLMASNTGAGTNNPSGNSLAGAMAYAGAANPIGLAAGALAPTGNQAHPNLQPGLVLNLCIAFNGIFPTRP